MGPILPVALLVMTAFPGFGASPLEPPRSGFPVLLDGCVWEVVPSPNISPERNLLRGVSAVGGDVWAVGEYDADPSPAVTNPHTLAIRWNGIAWSVVSTPNVGEGWNVLESVVMITAGDVWAVGWTAPTVSGGTPQTLTLQWDGRDWQIVNSPTIVGGSQLLAVDAAHGEIWAVGDRAGPGDGSTGVASLAARGTGSSWDIVPTPNPGNARNHLYAVDVIGPNDVWAVGRYRHVGDTSRSFAVHWDGTAWNQVATPNLGLDDSLYDVEGVSADDVWAVGAFNDGTDLKPMTLHWDGTAWTVVENPGGGSALAVIASNDAWAVGTNFTHWDGSAWTPVSIPETGGSFVAASVAGPCDAWAVGRVVDSSGVFTTLTMHLTGPPSPSAYEAYRFRGFRRLGEEAPQLPVSWTRVKA